MNTVRNAQADSEFAAAEYKDFDCGIDPFAFNLDQQEAQINALFELATRFPVAWSTS